MAPAGLRAALDSNDAAPAAKFLRTGLPGSCWFKVLKQGISNLSGTWYRELFAPATTGENMGTFGGCDISPEILGRILEYSGSQKDQLRASSVSKAWWRATSRLPAWSTIGVPAWNTYWAGNWSRMGWNECISTLETITAHNPERLITGFKCPAKAKVGSPYSLAKVLPPHLETLDLKRIERDSGQINFHEWGEHFPGLKSLTMQYTARRASAGHAEMLAQIGKAFPELRSLKAALCIATSAWNRYRVRDELEAAAILAIAVNFPHLQTLALPNGYIYAGRTAADDAAFGAVAACRSCRL